MTDPHLPGCAPAPRSRFVNRRRGVAVAALWSLAALLSPALGAQEPTLAFLAEREGRVEVYLWQVGDAGARQLTDIGAPWGAYLQWSPDGRRLCVILNSAGLGLWVVDAATGHTARLTPLDFDVNEPCWDERGADLYFRAGDPWPPGGPPSRAAAPSPDAPAPGLIYRVAAAGGEPAPITVPGRWADLAPAPGGGLILAQDLTDGASRLIQVNAQGEQVRTWEPAAGEWLGAPAACGEALAAERLAGWHSTVVIYGEAPRTFALGERLLWFPTWSPDGRRLLVESVVNGRLAILALEMDSGQVRPWREAGANEWYPRWSADGRLVAFSSDRGGAWTIRVADAEGRVVAQAPGGFARAYGGVFRPAGGGP